MTHWFWIYDLPNWLFGTLTVLVFCAFGLTGLAVTRRWAPSLHHATLSHNDIVGSYFGAITVLYGITLGLLMIDVWTNFSETASKVGCEGGTVAALYRDVSHYPEPNRGRLQADVRRSTRHVIDVAWPEQRKGIIPKGNLAILDDIGNDLAAFEPASEEQNILHAEAYHQFNDLVQRRRSRILGVTEGLSASLWALILIGAVINIAVTWVLSPAQPKNALLDDGLDLDLARADDFPPGGNGSSIFREGSGVSGTNSVYLRSVDEVCR